MKVLREPLVHFAVAGTILFAAYDLVGGDADSGSATPVLVGAGEIRWLRETFSSQWRRAPSNEELRGLVTGLVEEELLAREARALGLDQGDTIVRRRLAQKLTFLLEGESQSATPSEDELRRHYTENAARFTTEPRISFTQVYFSPQRRQQPERDAAAALAAIAASGGNAAPGGDPLPLESAFRDLERQEVSKLFGDAFAAAVFAMTPGEWHGPVESGFGTHLALVSGFAPAEQLSFDAARDRVLESWRRQREREAREAYLAALRAKYGVQFDETVAASLAQRLSWADSE